jgi:thymidylate synthase
MKSAPRGQQVVEANVATLDIDPKFPIMEFADRKFNWKYFAGELAWYMQKTNTTKFISNFSSFWDKLTDTGVINSNYGHILLNYHPSTNTGVGVNGLAWAYNSLVKDKDSRQAVAFLNCPYYQYEGNRDFVCTMYLNFWIRHDRLDMKVQMRSNDIFFGLSYDAPWFSLVQQSMYLNLKKVYPNLELGMYYHCADNIHYYERHFDLVEKIISADVQSSPEIMLKAPLFYFDGNEAFLTPVAIECRQKIEDAVSSPDFALLKREDWKNILKSLINIQEVKPVII